MKESKKRDSSTAAKKKKRTGAAGIEPWDQSDLEFADEKVLERRLHQLKLQLKMAQDETQETGYKSSVKRKKTLKSAVVSSDSDSSDSDSSASSDSSSSANRFNNRKSSSVSEDGRKRRRSPIRKKKVSKEGKLNRSTTRNDRENNSFKAEKKLLVRRKPSPVHDKHGFRSRPKRSPSPDKRDMYSRVDTSRWHEKAKEFGKERNKQRDNDHDRLRVKGRAERNRSVSSSRVRDRSKEDRGSKKLATRHSPVVSRRKDSPEPARVRVSHETNRRPAITTRKLSPRDDRLGRHDDRRVDTKVTRRNNIRTGDNRDGRDRKEAVRKSLEKTRDREVSSKPHRELVDHRVDSRDRSRVNEERFKERDKKVHERNEPERNTRNARNDVRDVVDDKFRRADRSADSSRENNRHPNESVFDRIRNRYHDRRNAEGQRFGRADRDRAQDTRRDRSFEKEPVKHRSIDSNSAERTIRDRKPNLPVVQRAARSPYRARKEPIRNAPDGRRTPPNFERKFSSPLNSRKANVTVHENNRLRPKRRSLEKEDINDDRKKGVNKTGRSRSKSSEKRRRRSSQEEWRIIDMTSPVLDDEFSDANGERLNEINKQKRLILSKLKSEDSEENENKLSRTILTDELSDISDEDFNDVNASSSFKIKKDFLQRNDRLADKHNQTEQKDELDIGQTLVHDKKNATNELEDIINERKENGEDSNEVDVERNEQLDSEEETVSRISDAIGVDWADLVEESKKKMPNSEHSSRIVREKWNGLNIFTKIGISEKYAGKDLFDEMKNELSQIHEYGEENPKADDRKEYEEKILHTVPSLHISLKDRLVKRKTLFEPYKTAMSARKDITIRRQLCGLPVKNINAQHMIGICHWIV